MTVAPAIALPSISRTRRTIWLGVAVSAIFCAVPETASREAYSGRAPSAGVAIYVLAAAAIALIGGLALFRRKDGELAVVL